MNSRRLMFITFFYNLFRPRYRSVDTSHAVFWQLQKAPEGWRSPRRKRVVRCLPANAKRLGPRRPAVAFRRNRPIARCHKMRGHKFHAPASSRSVFSRNCPHAASMSPPFSRRSVAVTFCFSSAARKPSQTSSLGRCHGKSSTGCKESNSPSQTVFWPVWRADGFAPANH